MLRYMKTTATVVTYFLLALSQSAWASEPPTGGRPYGPAIQITPASSAAQAGQTTRQGRISGFVFEDRNRNGIFDGDDVRLAQQLVLLTSPDRTRQVGSAKTAKDGSFHFDNLVATDYRVSVEIQEGFERTNDDSLILTVTEDGVERTVQFGVAARTPR
jgi:hypothetical protein